jgi:hypothetical protein
MIMRKYEVVVTHIVDEFIWNVYEKATSHVIETFFFEEDAIEFASFMDRGGAFDGFTPAFMLKPILGSDLNAKFERLIA